jgi:GT2 family glycosyltransferase
MDSIIYPHFIMPIGSIEDDKLVSIIIVNYNSGSLLLRNARSILDSNYTANRVELVIDDNNSQNTSLDNFQTNLRNRLTNPSNGVIIRNDENEGSCKTINLGLVKTQGDIIIIIFSNPDAVNSTNAISKITSHLNSNNEIRIYQFSPLLPSDEPEVAAAYLDPLGYAYSFMVNRATLVSFGGAVAIAIKHDVMNRIGNLDGDYFIEHEDQFFWGALLYGFKILYALGAIAQHYRGKLEKPIYFIRERRDYLYTRNHISTLKNLQLHNLLYFLPQVLLIELFKALLVLVAKRNFRLSLKIVDSIVVPFRVLPSLRKKRAKVQQSRSIPVKDVLKYFVPFIPLHQLNYPKHQAAGKKYMIDNRLLLKILAAKGMMS